VNWTTLLISIVLQIPLLATDQKLLVTGTSTVPVAGWLALGYLIVFATALGQQAWLWGVQGVGPARAGVFINLIPVSALLLSAVILGEPIGMKEVAGIALILAGVWLVGWQTARSRASHI
jgi:drug/metabolite transporter (DMT)-like permease